MWSISKALQIPLDKKIKLLSDTPYTISYVIRKRQQIDNYNELPKEKRPTDYLIWDGTSDEVEEWLDKVFKKEGVHNTKEVVLIDDIEG